MAWTVKPSATMEIPRRSEPYVTDEMKRDWTERILPRYETRLGALMPILHATQHAWGWITPQAMEEIAAFLEIDPSQVLDTATFYEEFHTHPVGKHVIAICQSIACEACGHQAILDHVRGRLGIDPHETTTDGKFTLMALECLGACDTAPCALVDDDRHDDLTIAAIDQVIDRLST
ncbi:MAG: NADH-quinone oxidoreductase subunit NuoE [Phycisphaerales bacterium]|jgi:NADH-quinone oxidoreductase subunit E|nr:NADH-quinone oxidoreductase subunit NuoE [Phycisphaerales bacterium]